MGFIVPGRNNTKLFSSKSNVTVDEGNILKSLHYTAIPKKYKKQKIQTNEIPKLNIYDIPGDILKQIFLNLDLSDIDNLPIALNSHFKNTYTIDSFWRLSYLNKRISEKDSTLMLELYEHDYYLNTYLNSVLEGKLNNLTEIENIQNLLVNVDFSNNNKTLINFIVAYTESAPKVKSYEAFLWAYLPMMINVTNTANAFKYKPWFCYTLEQICLLIYQTQSTVYFSNFFVLCMEMSLWMYAMRLSKTYKKPEVLDIDNRYFNGCFIKFIILNMIKNPSFHVHKPEDFAMFIKNLIIYVGRNKNTAFDFGQNDEEKYDIDNVEIQEAFRNKDVWTTILRAVVKHDTNNDYEKHAYTAIYNLLMKQLSYEDGLSKIPDVMNLL